MTIERNDHERIWLQNAADADECEGRMWCQDKVWPDDHEDSEPTEYVRADLYRALLSEIERLREALKPFAGYMAKGNFDLDNKGEPLPDEQGVGWVYLTNGDFRKASRALNDRTSKEGNHG